MKKALTTIFIIVIMLSVAGVAFIPQPAEAACLSIPFHLTDCVADFGGIIQGFFGVLLTIAATILSVSLNLTIHIKDIYNATPAIENVWVIVRNISSLFIIFMLLYSSISTILGAGTSGITKLIGKIVMAGLLINFSLFFTKVAIDASNVVSLQFYRAIAPGYVSSAGTGMTLRAFSDGGLSNVFLQSLKIQKIYHPDTNGLLKNVKDEGSIFIKIIIGTYGSVILMIFAIISFLGAAVAFTIRTGVLLILMAFSPVYFAGMIFPEIKKDVSDEWLKLLKNQLFFMPIYLALLYVSLRIISDDGFMSFLQTNNSAQDGQFSTQILGVFIQYFIAIFFINVPLLAAIKFGAIGSDFATKMTKGFKEKIYSQPGFLLQHSAGRIAKTASGAIASSGWASRNPNMAIMLNKGLGKVSGSSFGSTKGGYDARTKAYEKTRTEFINKNIKLNDTEKKQYIESGLANWEKKKIELQSIIDKNKAKAATEGISEKEKMKAMKEAAEAANEFDAMDKAEKAGNQDKHLEGMALKEKKEKAAANIEGKDEEGERAMSDRILGFGTFKSRQAIAKAVRDELNKSEDKKLEAKIKKMIEGSEKESEDKGGNEKDNKPKTT